MFKASVSENEVAWRLLILTLQILWQGKDEVESERAAKEKVTSAVLTLKGVMDETSAAMRESKDDAEK